MKITRTEIAPMIFLNCVTTEKFKTGCLFIGMLDRLSRENASQNALIPQVLRRGSTLHPDMESITKALDNLYGSGIEPYVGKKGEIQIVGFTSSFIDDRIAPNGENILEQISTLTCELLLNPNTKGGLFLPSYVDSEKEKILDRIRSIINEKRSYSMHRLRELMCYGEAYSIDRLGSEAEAESANYQSLTRRWRELLTDAPIEILYCGSRKPEDVEKIFKSHFEPLPRSGEVPDLYTDIRMNTVDETARHFTEELDVTQGKLALGFRLGETFDEEKIPQALVFNAVYGGSVTSKLFMNVREKLSLCYFAGSGLDSHKAVMLVSSGIEFDKYDEALNEILAQLDAIKTGDFTEDELIAAKKSVSSDYRADMDRPHSILDFTLSQIIRGLDYDPEELAALVETVTREEVIEIASGVECDAVYFLKGTGKEDNNGN